MVDMGTLVGTVRRFGSSGPPYEIVGIATPSSDGAPQMRISLVESGEQGDYPVSAILDDPLDDY